MVMRNTCLYPHNRCSFNGPSFSVRRVELCWYMEKMDRIPDGSLCVFASMSMSMQISITMSDALKKISISYNGLAIFSPLISSSVFLNYIFNSDLVQFLSYFIIYQNIYYYQSRLCLLCSYHCMFSIVLWTFLQGATWCCKVWPGVQGCYAS